jgi:hypothetical protein
VTVAENVATGSEDAEPVRRGAVRIYFDSTEVQHPGASTAKLGRIGDPKLHAALRKVGSQPCVPDLVIEEIARDGHPSGRRSLPLPIEQAFDPIALKLPPPAPHGPGAQPQDVGDVEPGLAAMQGVQDGSVDRQWHVHGPNG